MGNVEILVINGVGIKFDFDAELEVTNLSRDMDQVAAKMAYWGALWAEAEKEHETADAHYRRWRADYGQKLLAGDGKSAEWKVRQEIESDPTFLELKTALATAMRNTTMARAIYESFRTKANILQSKGAMARAELDATGMVTRRQEKTAKDESMNDKIEQMKAINKAKSKAKSNP